MKFTIEDLLTDDSFVDYCLRPDSPYRHTWEMYIEANPEQLPVLDEARALLQLLHPRLTQSEINVEMHKMYHSLDGRSSGTPAKSISETAGEDVFINKKGRLQGSTLRRVLAGGFCTLVVAMLVYAWWPAQKNQATVSISYIETKSGPGERKRIRLPDGSLVILNANSRISYKNVFNKSDRHIDLEGEAYFEVQKNPSLPFVVNSNGFSTVAVGTAFYVNGRHPRESYKVSLREGKVRVKNQTGEQMELSAGQQAQWTASGYQFNRVLFDTTSISQWIDGRLSIKKEQSKHIFSLLSEWYGVDIEDRRKQPRDLAITGDYSHKTIDDMLKVICFSLSCNYQMVGDKIVIE